MAGGGGGGGGGGQQNLGAGQLAFLANSPSDPYATPAMDPTAFDPSSVFSDPLITSSVALGPDFQGAGSGDSGMGLLPWPGSSGGDSGSGTEAPQGPARAQEDQSGGLLSQFTKALENLNPVSPAQAKEGPQTNPWVTGGPAQGDRTQPIKFTSPEQYIQQHPELDRPNPGLRPGEAPLPPPRPDTNVPLPQSDPRSQIPLPRERPPQVPPPSPEPQQAAIPLPRPRPQQTGTAPPTASAAPPGGGQQGFDPLRMIEQIFGLPGQIISSLLGISTQATPNYRYNAQRGGQTLSNLGNILAGHPELQRHGMPQQTDRSYQQPQQRTPSGQPAPEHNTPPQHQEDGAPRPDAKAAAAGQSSDVPAHVLAGARQAAMQGGPGAVFKWMAQNGHPHAGNWCGEFAAAVMQSQGLPVPEHPEIASNWRNWGHPTTAPQAGDVAIRNTSYMNGRYVPTGELGAHVTTVERVYPDGSMDIIGGNQSQMREHVSQQGYDFRTMSAGDAGAPRPPGRIPTPQPQRMAMRPPMHGARRGRDGRWYVHRGGRYYRVAEDQPQNAQA